MKVTGELTTPVYLKTAPAMPWPDQSIFYLLTADGLFLCRDHPFFRSTVPAPVWPSELESHNASLVVRYPKIPRQQMELIVSFFAHVGHRYSAEAIVLLGWNKRTEEVETIVPEQVAFNGRNRWGDMWPISVDYKAPTDLSSDVVIFGDIHSHVDGAAYASFVDRDDETHRPGLHIVIGRVFDEPPEFFVQAVVDGTRFNLKLKQVLEGYRRRTEEFPDCWLDRVSIKCGGKTRPARPRPEQAQDEGDGESKSAADTADTAVADDAILATNEPNESDEEQPDGDTTETST